MVHVGREARPDPGDELLDAIGGLHRIRAGQLVRRDNRAGLPIQAAYNAVILDPQLDARHIFEAHDRSSEPFTNNDLSELLGSSEPTPCSDGGCILLTPGDRLAAD